MHTRRRLRSTTRFVEACAHALALALIATFVCGASAWALGGGADGKYEKRTSSHFVLYQDVDIDQTSGLRGSRRFEQDVLAALETAYQQVDARVGLRPSRPITVTVHDPAIFDQRFSGLFRFPAAGFYGGTVHVRGATLLDARLERTLYHELVHAAFDAEASALYVPAWMNEGVAEWFEARALGKRGLSSGEANALSRVIASGQAFALWELAGGSFGQLGPGGARVAYLQSYAFIDYLAARAGERRLRDWVRESARSGDLDRATRRIFKADLDELERDHLEARSLRGGR